MAEIIGVKFKESGKLYYFQPNDQYLLTGTKVIVETSRGTECGEVVMERRAVPDDQITHELKKVLREATADDLRRVEENHRKEEAAFKICEQKILDHKLEMKLVSVEYAFDGSKIQFCFTADGRVDFRELVKDLAGVFHTRIELRQIGVRDEAKMLGGLGICGRPFCCSSFLGDFIPVSIKMAKEQGLSLNPVKISGACGRLMCCLKYEEEAYHDLSRHTPKVGMHVNTPEGTGTVFEVNLITGDLRIVMDNMPEAAPRTFNKRQVSAIGGTEGLSEAEAAMFSSYRHEEPVTEDEQQMLEQLDDEVPAQKKRAAGENGYRSPAKGAERERQGRRDQNRQGQPGKGSQQRGGRGQSSRDAQQSGGQGGGQNGGQGGGKGGQPKNRQGQQTRDNQQGQPARDGQPSQNSRENQQPGRSGQNKQQNRQQNNRSRQNGEHTGKQNSGAPKTGKGDQNQQAHVQNNRGGRPPQNKNGQNDPGKSNQGGANRGRQGQSNRGAHGRQGGQNPRNNQLHGNQRGQEPGGADNKAESRSDNV